jgi:ubiquinone/menaquinone biosynthesis C-methylase UbiE
LSASDDQKDVYEGRAEAYDRLVSAEDAGGALIAALAARRPLQDARIVEVGVGTARIARQLLDRGAAHVAGFDRAPAMLDVARARLSAHDASRWSLAVADASSLPVGDACADMAVAGWVFGHFRLWMPDGWREAVSRAIAEMKRVLFPEGVVVIVETMGTGTTTAAPPSEALGEYYAWLEGEGFTREVIRTDYHFASVDDAAAQTGFFFGEEMAARVRRNAWSRVPEHTGVWSLQGRK